MHLIFRFLALEIFGLEHFGKSYKIIFCSDHSDYVRNKFNYFKVTVEI